MATLHSFYLPPDSWHEPYQLQGPEAHHLSRVLRIKPQEQIRLFDGEGRSGLFLVTRVEKHITHLAPQSIEKTPPPSTRCTLAAGFSKALRRSWFFEKAVELEAHALWFWQGDYSQAALPDEEKNSWKSQLIAGAKQSENTWLPDLTMLHGGIDALVTRMNEFDRTLLLYERETDGRILSPNDFSITGDILLIIGPEGGFSQREIQTLLAAKAQPVSLGNRVLRWETAAVLTLGIAWWARQLP